jgi:hypothetical protein
LGLTETGLFDQFEFRFYFETLDNDVFLNNFQLFNIATDDIIVTTEKV